VHVGEVEPLELRRAWVEPDPSARELLDEADQLRVAPPLVLLAGRDHALGVRLEAAPGRPRGADGQEVRQHVRPEIGCHSGTVLFSMTTSPSSTARHDLHVTFARSCFQTVGTAVGFGSGSTVSYSSDGVTHKNFHDDSLVATRTCSSWSMKPCHVMSTLPNTTTSIISTLLDLRFRLDPVLHLQVHEREVDRLAVRELDVHARVGAGRPALGADRAHVVPVGAGRPRLLREPAVADLAVGDPVEHERLGAAVPERADDRRAVGLPERIGQAVPGSLLVVPPAPVLLEEVERDPRRGAALLAPGHHRLAVEVVELRVVDLDVAHGARSVI